jgi:hypothetical protein
MVGVQKSSLVGSQVTASFYTSGTHETNTIDGKSRVDGHQDWRLTE